MSEVSDTLIIDKKKGYKMYHYDDRFYVSNCSTCEQEFATKSVREMKTLEEFHECGNAELDKELGNYAKFDNNYLVEFTPTAEFTKPMFTTNRH